MDQVESHPQMLGEDPSSRAFISLVESLFERERYSEAIEICIKGLRVRPYDLRARVILGVSCLRTGELDRAETELLKAADVLEINSVAYAALAELYDKKGDAQQACRYRQLFETLQSASEFGSDAEALEPEPEKTGPDLESEYKGIPASEPEVATITMAELYAQQGYLEEAAVVYRKILETAPETAGIEERLAEVEKRIGDSLSGPSLLTILESWRNQLRERAATENALSPLESPSFDPEKLAAFIRKHLKKTSSS